MLCLFHGLLQKSMITDFAWWTVVTKEHQIVRKKFHKRRRVSAEPLGVSDTYGAHCPHFQHVSRSAQRGEWVRSVVFGFRSEEDGTRKIGKVLRFLKMETKKAQKKMILPRKLTYPLKNDGWKTIFLLKCSLFRGDVNFHGCICSFVLFLGNGTTSPKPQELLFICLASSYATGSKAFFWDTSFFSQKKRLQHSGYDPLFGKKTILETNTFLGGGFKNCNFHPYLGKISILTNIFQMGWNHHLDLEGCNFARFVTFLWDFSLWVPVGAWWLPLTLSYTSKNTQKLKNWQQSYTCKIDAWESAELDRCDRCELRNVSGRLPNIALDTGRIPWVWYFDSPFLEVTKKPFPKGHWVNEWIGRYNP